MRIPHPVRADRWRDFSPATMSLMPFLRGEAIEHHMAAGCAAELCSWFILEFAARMLSSREWLEAVRGGAAPEGRWAKTLTRSPGLAL